MANYGYGQRKRYKIKYKNLALLLAILLLIVILISRGCSAIFGKKDKEDKPDRDNALQSGDILPDTLPENNLPLAEPNTQAYYAFTSETKTAADLGTGDLVLVNNNIAFKGSVSESDLDVIREKKNKAYSVKDYTVLVRPEAMNALNDMLLAFYNATGKDTIMVNAGYRTLEYQQDLYADDLDSTGLESSSLVAKPGFSEHHTGLAVDFTVYENGKYDQSKLGTGDYTWIDENAHKYGFVNRYPKGKESITMIDNEPWHFRYVGVPHATAMKEYDLCLEQYIDFLRNYTIDTEFLSVTTEDGSQYMIYYVPMAGSAENPETTTTNVYIPLKVNTETEKVPYPYEISGNNVDGWIVTFLYKEGTGVINAVPPTDDAAVTTSADDAEPESPETEAPEAE